MNRSDLGRLTLHVVALIVTLVLGYYGFNAYWRDQYEQGFCPALMPLQACRERFGPRSSVK